MIGLANHSLPAVKTATSKYLFAKAKQSLVYGLIEKLAFVISISDLGS